MGRIARGWALTRQSWDVLKGDASLALFPILSTIFATLAMVSIWAPTLITRGVFDHQTVERNDPVVYAAGVASAYVSTFIALFFNIRASFKLALDWRGMLVTTRFVRDAYARLGELPTEDQLEREPAAPVFLHLVPAFQEPDIAVTVGALVASRYPHGRLHVVVVTKEEEERDPHPVMGVSTGELVRRLRETLPPYQQKRLSHVVMPGPGRKAHQLNWGLRPEVLREVLAEETDPSRVFVGVSDADSIPDPDTYRWIAHRELGGQGSLAYQGIPLSLANYDRLTIRGKICAIQQSSIFIRVSIARLLNEVKRVRLLARLTERLPRLA